MRPPQINAHHDRNRLPLAERIAQLTRTGLAGKYAHRVATPPSVPGTVLEFARVKPSVGGQVDIIIAAWTAEDTVARAVSSALAQEAVARVIVVDDASADGTMAAARACGTDDDRLLVLRQTTNAGPSAARNRAIAAGNAPWIAILDADDLLQPGRIARLLAQAEGCDIIGDDLLVVDEGAEADTPRLMLGSQVHDAWLDLPAFVMGNVADGSGDRAELGYIKPLMRRSFLDAHRLRYDESIRLGEDYDLYLRALVCGARFRVVSAQGYIYVQRADSISGNHGEEDLRRLREVDRRVLGMPGLDRGARAALSNHYRSVDCRFQWRRVIRAFKERKPGEIAGAFTRSPQVSLYLLGKLGEQVVVRLGRQLRIGAAPR